MPIASPTRVKGVWPVSPIPETRTVPPNVDRDGDELAPGERLAPGDPRHDDDWRGAAACWTVATAAPLSDTPRFQKHVKCAEARSHRRQANHIAPRRILKADGRSTLTPISRVKKVSRSRQKADRDRRHIGQAGDVFDKEARGAPPRGGHQNGEVTGGRR